MGKQLVKSVVELDTGERDVSHKVAPVHKFGQKDGAAWARKFFLTVRGLIARLPAVKETYAGKTERDSAHDKQGMMDR